MDKKEKILFAKQQLSEMWKCDVNAFDSDKNIFIESDDTFFQMITFGNNAVIRADKKMIEWCSEKFNSITACFIMDSDNFYLINEKLRTFGKKLGEENIRYLHLFPEKTVEKPFGFTYKWYRGEMIKELHQYKEFVNALTFNERDMIDYVAYDGEKIAAMAGSDDWLKNLWQIGIDTVKEYRKRGLALYLVKELALEIEKNNKVAYYTTWSANIASTRVALNTGFYPVWVDYGCEDL